MFKNWEWNDTVATIFTGVVLTLLVFAGIALTANHKPQYYYLLSGGASMANTTCVVAGIDWLVDDTVYCSDDVNKVTDILTKMQSAVKSH